MNGMAEYNSGSEGMDERGRYQLRKAAGLFWLVDMEQSGAERQEQIVLNESGAYIWRQYERLQSETAVAEVLSSEFGISAQEGLADIRQFFQQLKEQGLDIQKE